MAQVLDSGVEPTAVFAANNAIAMGVLDELERRGLRVPQDIALVCFDDLPNTSRLFPFLTVAVQPAYEIGANAAQLLLSRLEAKVPLQPRHVVLPTRLIIRYSCGSKLEHGRDPVFSLPMAFAPSRPDAGAEGRSGADAAGYACPRPLGVAGTPRQAFPWPRVIAPTSTGFSSAPASGSRSRAAPGVLDHQPVRSSNTCWSASWTTHRRQWPGGQCDSVPEDHVEFAQRLGMDAVTCNFSWRPNNVFARASDGSEHYVGGSVRNWSDLENLEPPPSLAQQLNTLERTLRARPRVPASA